MNKCLKITLQMDFKENFLKDVIQKNARQYNLEGFCQVMEKKSLKIIVCGEKDNIDGFIDILHKETAKANVEDIEIEPFIKDKDYRGVFRVIE
jgi:acylphosphatase